VSLFHLSRQQDFRQIDSEGVPIGIDAEWDYPQTTFRVEKDDLLIFYTDGITEAMNIKDQQFGFERLKQVIAENGDDEPAALKKKIFAAIDEFVGSASQHDDETLIIVRKK
jgi:sigma-B regulation protein RsbU (phosphoserine phosphatase)